jgi:hypothetical protein
MFQKIQRHLFAQLRNQLRRFGFQSKLIGPLSSLGIIERKNYIGIARING